ncbi:unnamed protein product [Polarella glacialis]|uniref:Piezo non-specific cation channel R-Ras-binding domain-containing protein n=1 Tax=Polarella glacialis TaxID=89957 RepID=A0A813GJ65_POLGL|nr:unnamed protein product [Polarella glacialis]
MYVATNTAFLLLFSFQLWSERLFIQGASWRRFVVIVQGLIVRDRPPELVHAFDELRIDFCTRLFVMARQLYPILVSLGFFIHSHPEMIRHRVLITVFYGVFLLFDVELLKQKPWLVDALAYTAYFGLSISLLIFPYSELYFIFSTRRSVLAMYAGILFCDARKAAVCSLGMFALKIHSFNRQVPCTFRTEVIEGFDPFPSYFVSEFHALLMSVLFFYIVEQWIQYRLWDLVEKHSAESSKMAASALLSVLCDADLALDHELRIVGPCTRLVRLLSSAFLSCVTEALDGLEFPSMLVEADQPRFLHFIKSSVQRGGGFNGYRGVAPPSSIQVHINGGSGSRGFKVELFLVSLRDCNEKGQPCHLIGLKDASEVPGLGFNSPEHTDVPAPNRTAVVTESSSSEQELPGTTLEQYLAEDSHGPVIAPSIRQASFESRSQSSASSVASAGSSGDTTLSEQLDAADMPEIKSISFEIDADSKDFTMFSVAIAFNVDAFQGNRAAARPGLNAWFTGDSGKVCRDWLFAVVNEWYGGSSVSVSCPRLTLYYPGQDPYMRLVASTVTAEQLEAEDTDVPSSGFAVRLKLSNFKRYRKRPRETLRFSRRRVREQQLQQQQQQPSERRHAMPSIDEDDAVRVE